MFEGLVSDALNKYLGKFVDLDKQNVQASVWSGTLDLVDVSLRASAFDSLGMPVSLVAGSVGRIHLEIPWSSLGKKPVKVHIDSVFACLRLLPQATGDGDPVPFKRAALEADEAAWWAAGEGSTAEESKANSALKQKILDNVQVHFSNLHIRFEDPVSCPSHPFAVGVTLDTLSIHSANADWQEQFVETPQQLLYKVVDLGGPAEWATAQCAWAGDENGVGLSVYCISGEHARPLEETPGTQAWRARMLSMVHPAGAAADGVTQSPPITYVLCPWSASLRVTVDRHDGRGFVADAPQPGYEISRREPFSDPIVEARVQTDEIAIVLDYSTAQCFASLGSWFGRRQHEPPPKWWNTSPTMSAERKACLVKRWWKWAYKFVIKRRNIASHSTALHWPQIVAACTQRRRYAGIMARSTPQWIGSYGEPGRHYGLYERKYATTYSWLRDLNGAELQELQQLEDGLPVPVVQAWRRQALQQLNDELHHRKKNASWWSRPQAAGLTEEQLQFLQGEIGYDRMAANDAIPIPPKFVKTRMCLDVGKIHVSLRKSRPSEEADGVPTVGSLAELQLSDTACAVDVHQNGWKRTEASVKSLRVCDQCSPTSKFPTVVEADEHRCKDMHLAPKALQLVLDQNAPPDVEPSLVIEKQSTPVDLRSTTLKVVVLAPDTHRQEAVSFSTLAMRLRTGEVDRQSRLYVPPNAEEEALIVSDLLDMDDVLEADAADDDELIAELQQQLLLPDILRARVSLAPLRVVYNPHLVEMLLDFAQLGDDTRLLVALKALQETFSSMMAFVKQTASCAEVEMQRKQFLDVAAMLHGPTILVPDDCSSALPSCVRLCMGRLHLATGELTSGADVFHAALSDIEADVCNYQPSTGLMTNSRPILSRAGTSSVTIRNAFVQHPDSVELDVRGAIPEFNLVISDELLLSMSGITSSIMSKRQGVLAEIGKSGRDALHAAQAAAETIQLDTQASALDSEALSQHSSSMGMVVSIGFGGLRVELVKATQELAQLQLHAMTVGVKQSKSGSLRLELGVRALMMTDSCSPSKDSLSAIVSSATSGLAAASADGASDDLLSLCIDLEDTTLNVEAKLQSLQIVYNPYLTERLLELYQSFEPSADHRLEQKSVLHPQPVPLQESKPAKPALHRVSVTARCALLEVCGIDHLLDKAGQEIGPVPEGVPDAFKHITWVQHASQQCVWAAALARSRIFCKVNTLQCQTTAITDRVASSPHSICVHPSAVVDIDLGCDRVFAPLPLMHSVGQLDISTALKCTKRPDQCGELQICSGGDIVVSRHDCNSTIRMELGESVIIEKLLNLCDGDWSEAQVRQLYRAGATQPFEVEVGAVHMGFRSPGSTAYQEFFVLPPIRCDLLTCTRQLRISARPRKVEHSRQQTVLSVNVSAALCETVVALLGQAGESLCIHNHTSFEFRILWEGMVSSQLAPSGVHRIRSPNLTQEFRLQIPGCQPSETIRVASRAAAQGQPICIPHGVRQTFVRIDVSDTVVRIKPAFTVENRLPESVFLALKQRTASGSVNIQPGQTKGVYSNLNGKFPLEIEFIRVECENERHDSYKTCSEGFPVQFVDGQEYDVRLIDEASGRIKMKLVVVFETAFEMVIFSRFWIVNRLMIPLKVKANGRWCDECWPSALSPGAVFTVPVGKANHIHVSVGKKWHEINIKRKGSGALPLDDNQLLDYSIDDAPSPFSGTTVLKIGMDDVAAFDKRGRCTDPWSIKLDVPLLEIAFADMASGMLCYWPQFPPQRLALRGALFSLALRDMLVEVTTGSDEHNVTTTEVKCCRIGSIQIRDLEKRNVAIDAGKLEASGWLEQQGTAESMPTPPMTLSVRATMGNIRMSITDQFLMVAMAVQQLCMMYVSQLDGPTLAEDDYFAMLRRGLTPDVQLAVAELSLSGTGGGEIPVQVNFFRNTEFVLPQVRELCKVPLGEYPGPGWKAKPALIRSFAGNTNGLLGRLIQAGVDNETSSLFSLVFGEALPRLDQVITVVAANALDVVGAGALATVQRIGEAPTKALEAGKLARGGRLDDGYQFGDLTIGAGVRIADHIGAAAGTVGEALSGVLGSSKPARWVFADASGPLGQTAYRANPARWKTGTFDTIAAELSRQGGVRQNARRAVVLRYTEGKGEEREIELGSCAEAVEWIHDYTFRYSGDRGKISSS